MTAAATPQRLTGAQVVRLMTTHKKTIAGLAQAMNVTQVRVRQVRARGVIEGAHYVRDWLDAIQAQQVAA